MSTMSVTLPDPLRQRVERLAASRGLSVDEIVSDAVAEYLAQGADPAVGVLLRDLSGSDPAPSLDRYGQEVVQYAAEHELGGHASRMLEVIRRHFPAGSIVEVRPAFDPDAGDDWLSVRLAFVGSPEAFLAAYRGYLDEFARLVPWPTGAKLRLSYWIVQA